MNSSPKCRLENSHLGRSSRRKEAHSSWLFWGGTRQSQSLLASAATYQIRSKTFRGFSAKQSSNGVQKECVVQESQMDCDLPPSQSQIGAPLGCQFHAQINNAN